MSKTSTMTPREYLASKSIIDCDTLDPDVPKSLGPFQDCTSNQAILYAELSNISNKDNPKYHHHNELLERSIAKAKEIVSLDEIYNLGNAGVEELAVDLCALGLLQEIAQDISGFVHVQVNPFHAHDREKIVANARRLVALTSYLPPSSSNLPPIAPLSPTRLIIKIPSTHSGLLACHTLETQYSIKTLATTLFSPIQSHLASYCQATYIAPYVLDLAVHFDPDYQFDEDSCIKEGVELCANSQRYFNQVEKGEKRTKVLAASLTTIPQLLSLAGCNHITISPPLLHELANCSPSLLTTSDIQTLESKNPFLSDTITTTNTTTKEQEKHLNQEDLWYTAFVSHDKGRSASKLKQAIEIFCGFQMKLEGMVRRKKYE